MKGTQSVSGAEHLIPAQYTVIELLGQGASGAVYLVADEHANQKRFALKKVMGAVREEHRGFPYEHAALQRLSHPALPRIYRVLQSDDHERFYILMDYAEGSSLEVVRQVMPGKRFSLHAALTLLTPVMEAVSYLHRQHPHLIHGDIKPSNIIVPIAGASTPAKLVDFGGTTNVSSDAGQRTLNFRAPEQFGKSASRRTDVYALGAIYYTLLTGTVPPAACDRLARLNAGEPDPLVPMDQFTPSDQILAGAIHRALSIRRNDRFDSVEQFRAALWQVIHADPLPPVTHLPEPEVVVPAEKPHAVSDDSLPEVETPAPDDDATIQLAPSKPRLVPAPPEAEIPAPDDDATMQAAPSGPLLAPAPPGEGKPPGQPSSQGGSAVLRRKKRRVKTHGKHKRRALLLAGLVFLLVCATGAGIANQAYAAQYQKEVALAQAGIQHLQTAVSLIQGWSKNPFAAASVTPARREFAAASATFAQLDTDLHALPGVGTSIPGIGTRLSAALHVVPVAMSIAQAGVIGCDALNVLISGFREPLSTGNGLTLEDLTAIGEDLHQVEADFKQASAQVNALQPGDLQLDPRVGKAVAAFHHYLPSLQALLHEADQLLPVLPALLGIGTPAYYLVEILDSTQLRPGGGFIKDYGFATLSGGRLSAAHVSDTNLLDTRFTATGQTLTLPPAYSWFTLAPGSWSLRDSNLDADFPTAAVYAEQNFNRESPRVALQGVMAVTTTFMEHMLAITGPIAIPELHETVTATNLVDRIHYYELGPGGQRASVLLSPGGPSTPSRYFIERLAQGFLARMHQLSSSALPKVLQSLGSALRTKDLQIYFNAPAAEDLLTQAQLAAAIRASTGDNLLVVDANLAADNANQFITSALDDRVTIDGSGNATHQTTMRYAWVTNNGAAYGPPLYRDYVRVYVPQGSSLQAQQGWQPQGTSRAFSHEVWAGFFTLSYGQTVTVTLTWKEKGIAKEDAAGWHYRYLVQRQAGATWTLGVQVTLPACAVRTHTSGGHLAQNGRSVTLAQSLTEDTNLEIDYRC